MSRIRDIANLFSGSTDAATDAEVAAAITAHNNATTSVHGISNTASLATSSSVSSSISTHSSATDPHGDRAFTTSAIASHNTIANGHISRGNTASRPVSPVIGDMYSNTTLQAIEIYTSTGWIPLQQRMPAAYTLSNLPASFIAGDSVSIAYSGIANQTLSTLNATSIKIECYGASGSSHYTTALKGGYAYGNLSLSSTETLYLNVGGQGGARVDYAYQAASSPWVNTGGFNGGGNGGGSYDSRNNQLRAIGPGGGGATDVRRSGTALSNRIIVAGGGGVSWRANGGDGGGTSGGNGVTYSSQNADYGNGGTQTAGGTNSANSAANGSLGQGGNGVNLTGGDYVGNNPGPGAGGGGGYYGGAGLVGSQAWGGNSSGSGGGSGYVGGVTNSGMTNGGQPTAGNGSILITVLAVG